jgi:uncharacterized protein (PEP-CTERM system associated)
MAVTANKHRPRGARTALVLPFLVLAYAPAAQALDWRFEPNVRASATYTDNVNSSATDPQDALVLTVTPGFSLRSEGSRRVQASLQYGLTAASRFGEDNSNDLYHRLSAVGNAELVEDFLFIDGNANISQELISLLGPTADAETNDSNRSTVGTYSISPYIQQRFGTFANALVRYTASGAIFENDVASNANSNTFAARLSSGTRFTDLSWGLDYSIRETQNRNADDTTFERISATAGYALTRKFRVFGTVGEDKNEYLSSSATEGSFYSAGFGWSPTRRTSVEASAGERYFGSTYSFSASHNTRQTRWNVRYSEDVSDLSRLVTDFSNLQRGVLKSCPPGTVFTSDPTLFDLISAGCDVDLYFGTSILNGVFISKLLTAGVSWDVGNRTTLSMRLSDLTREFQLGSQGEDRVQIVSGAINYRLSPRTSANGSLSFTRNSLDSVAAGGAAREDDILSLGLGLNHRFAEKLTGALTLRHTQRDSNAPNSDYDVNSITATVNMGF